MTVAAIGGGVPIAAKNHRLNNRARVWFDPKGKGHKTANRRCVPASDKKAASVPAR